MLTVFWFLYRHKNALYMHFYLTSPIAIHIFLEIKLRLRESRLRFAISPSPKVFDTEALVSNVFILRAETSGKCLEDEGLLFSSMD